MTPFFIYDSSNVRIIGTGNYDERGDNVLPANRKSGSGAVNPAGQYAPAGVVTARPPMAATVDKSIMLGNGIEVATFLGIPVGAVVSVQANSDLYPRSSVLVSDGTLLLKISSPGSYTVTITLFPSMDQHFYLQAN